MTIDFNNKNLADIITVIGELEHLYYHAKKSASSLAGKEEEVFHVLLAQKTQDFRRKYMAKHFPECSDELWCEGKAVEALRQRIYESNIGNTDDLQAVDELWAMVWGEITGEDLSGCASCRKDKK